jgi:hypothetical protein
MSQVDKLMLDRILAHDTQSYASGVSLRVRRQALDAIMDNILRKQSSQNYY